MTKSWKRREKGTEENKRKSKEKEPKNDRKLERSTEEEEEEVQCAGLCVCTGWRREGAASLSVARLRRYYDKGE